MPQTIHQRQALLSRLTTAPTAEQRAAQARDFAKRHPHCAATRFELERADRIEAQLQADALLARIRAAGEVGCAEPTDRPLTMPEAARLLALGFVAIAGLLAFGWLLRVPMARVLVALGVL